MPSEDYVRNQPASDESQAERFYVDRKAKEHLERTRAEAASIVAALDCPEDMRAVVLAHLGIESESSERQRQ